MSDKRELHEGMGDAAQSHLDPTELTRRDFGALSLGVSALLILPSVAVAIAVPPSSEVKPIEPRRVAPRFPR